VPSLVATRGFEADDVVLPQLKLGCILDRDQALAGVDARRQQVEQGGLAGAGAAADEDIEPRPHGRRQERRHLGAHRGARDIIVHRERLHLELADRQDRSVERDGGNDDVDARPVGQAGVNERGRLIHAPADRADDAMDDVHQMGVVAEARFDARELAAALDVDLVRTVDDDVVDRGIAQQRYEWAEPGDFVLDILDQQKPFGRIEYELAAPAAAADRLLDLLAQRPLAERLDRAAARLELFDHLLAGLRLGGLIGIGHPRGSGLHERGGAGVGFDRIGGDRPEIFVGQQAHA
jgi:hypothetical protein